LREWLRQSFRKPMRHVMANHVVAVESATEATGTLDGIFYVKGREGWRMFATARYTDRYRLSEGRWRIAERRFDSR
jgi:hypothetical protein